MTMSDNTNEIEVLTPLHITVFFEPPKDDIIYISNTNLFRNINSSSDKNDTDIHVLLKPGFAQEHYDTKFFTSIPSDYHGINIISSQNIDNDTNTTTNNKLNLVGMTHFIDFDKIDIIPIPIQENEILNEKQIEIFAQLAKDLDIDILITNKDSYNVITKQKKPLSQCLYLIGEKSKILQYEHHFKALKQKMSSNDNVIELLDLDSYSLLSYCIGSTTTTTTTYYNSSNFEFISKLFNVDILYPSLLTLTYNNTIKPQLLLLGKSTVLLTQAKHMISNHVEKLYDSLYYRKITNISPTKIAFIKNFCKDEIIQLMIRFQSFIKFNNDSIEFQSLSNDILQSLILNFTLSFLQNITELTIIYDLEENNPSTDNNNKNIDEIPLLSQSIMNILQSENFLLIKSNKFPNQITLIMEYYKLNKTYLNNLIQINSNIKQFKLIFEIHSEFDNFISGKKNGKLTRIMDNIPNCLIKLTSGNTRDINNVTMSLQLISDSVPDFPNGLKCMIDELPAEESFNIPEVYHRPIIGAGGSIIQTIMRKYNVFIQFSNTYLLPQNNFTITRYDNVIIRCPNKNKSNIKLAKDELFNLVNDFDNLQNHQTMTLTRGVLTSIIMFTGLSIISQIEKKNNVFIDFPTSYEDLATTNNNQESKYEFQIRANDSDTCLLAMNELRDKYCPREVQFTFIKKQFKSWIEDENNKILFYDEIVIPFLKIWKSIITLTPSSSTISMTYEHDHTFKRQTDIINEYFNKKKLQIVETHQLS